MPQFPKFLCVLGIVSLVHFASADLLELKLEGSGAITQGGNRGRVFDVTNTDDSGIGSLRYACESSGPRSVRFMTSGEIKLRTPIYITDPYITIDGSTAPGLITISAREELTGKAPFSFGTHDAIVRYLAFYKGFNKWHAEGEGGQGPGNFALWDGCYNIVVDHCSFLWTQDENVTVYGEDNHDITFQWCLFAEPYDHHPTNFIVGPPDVLKRGIDIHHCLFANASHRNPLFYEVEGRFINNLIYNWDWFAMGMPTPNNRVDIINNIWKAGPMRNRDRREISVLKAPQSLYLKGNKGPSSWRGDWNMVEEIHGLNFEPQGRRANRKGMERTMPLPSPAVPITIHPTDELEEIVLREVGASKHRSQEDERIIADYHKGTGGMPKK